MKTTRSRLRRTAACLVLAGALLSGCSLLPAASPRKDPAAAQPQPSDASAALNDGKLRMLYGSQGTMVLCGSTVLHEAASDETLTLLPDTLTGEAAYYWRSWADNTLPSGRRSALYDAAGAEVLAAARQMSRWCEENAGKTTVVARVKRLAYKHAMPLVMAVRERGLR